MLNGINYMKASAKMALERFKAKNLECLKNMSKKFILENFSKKILIKI
jgi:hypothetical protein